MTETGRTRTDEELVRAALAGNRESFTPLIRRYQHLVFGQCRHLLGCHEDAADATQDAFIAAFRRLGELRREADFKSWLRSIAVNICWQRLRSRRAVAVLEDSASGLDPYPGVDREIDVDRALDGLSDDARLTVRLYYFEGGSVREIAQFLGVPETTVMSRLRNSRSQLRRELQPMFDKTTKRSSLPDDFADRIPIPYDEYGPCRGADEFRALSAWRRDWLLSHYPTGSTIGGVEIVGHDWEAPPDSPVRVDICLPGGSSESVVLKMSPRREGIRTEAALLPILESLGLPVPKIVAGPVADPDLADRGLVLATTVPIGQSALAWAVDGGIKAIDHACEVVMEAIERVRELTASIEASPVGALLERCSLADELVRVTEIGGPWMGDSTFASAVQRLEPIVRAIDVPLVFSDSGIGPNARVDEQGNLIGFETFAWARIEDPHYQISKYWTYDCWPIRRAGFVERYLLRQGLSMREFAPRLGVRALVTLQREISVRGGNETYRDEMLGWLKLALDSL